MRRAASWIALLWLAGTVWCAPADSEIRGAILQPDGKPAAGAEVHLLLRQHQPEYSLTLAKSTTADARGAYSFGETALPDYQQERVVLTVVARLEGVGVGWEDLAPERQPPFDLTLLPTQPVTGKIVDSEGQRLPDAAVRASVLIGRSQTSRHTYLALPEDLSRKWAVTTDTQGRFELPLALAGGSPSLVIEAPGYGKVSARSGGQTQDPGAPVELHLSKPGGVAGQVTCADAGANLEGLPVTLRSTSPDKALYAYEKTTTDAQGRFAVQELLPGEVTVSLATEPQSEWQCVDSHTVALAEGGAVEGLQFELKRGTKVTGKVVETGSGKPVKGVSVYARHGTPREGRASNEVRVGETGDDGSYSFFALPGEAQVRVVAAPAPYVTPEYLTVKLTVAKEAAAAPDLALTRGVSLTGVVVDEAGKPVAGATVTHTARPFYADSGKTTGADGTFEIASVEQGKQFTVCARTETAFSQAHTVTAGEAKAPLRVVVKEGTAARVKGRLVDQDGKPAAGELVEIHWFRDMISSNEIMLTTDKEGRFRSGLLWPRGSYRANVKGGRYSPASTKNWDAEPGKEHDFGDLVLTSLSGFVAGVVVDSKGQPVAGADVWNAGDAAKEVRVATGADGTFKLQGFLPGSVYAFAEKDGYRLTGVCTSTGAADAKLILYRDDEPAPQEKLTPPPPPDEARLRKLAQRLIDTGFKKTEATKDDSSTRRSRGRLCGLQARLDPFMASALSAGEGHRHDGDVARTLGELALQRGDVDEACAYFDTIADPRQRLWAYLQPIREGGVADDELERALLERGLIAARGITQVPYRAVMLAKIGRALTDLGEPEARQLIDEAAALARGFALEGWEAYARGAIAEYLCDFDLESALQLVSPIEEDDEKYRHLGNLAYHIGNRMPDRAIKLITSEAESNRIRRHFARLCYRLTPEHLDKALELVDRDPTEYYRCLAYTWIARRLLEKDRQRALELLEQAAAVPLAKAKGHRYYDGLSSPSHDLAQVAALAAKWGHPKAREWLWRSLAIRATDEHGMGSQSRRADGRLAVTVATADAAMARELVEVLTTRVLTSKFEQEYESTQLATDVALAAMMVDVTLAETFLSQLDKAGINYNTTTLAQWALGAPHERAEILRQRMYLSADPQEDD